jgi:hypothetical protein
MTTSHRALILAAFFGICCARQQRDTMVPTASACPVPGIASPSRPWRQVLGAGFTYCVPSDWNPTDGRATTIARAWSHAGSMIEWAPGPPLSRITSQQRVVEVPAAHLAGSLEHPCEYSTGQLELIGDDRAELGGCGRGREYQTYAYWRDKEVHFAGTATMSEAAALQLAIYRTVRFTSAP